MEGEEGFTYLYRQVNSLEEWLERWLREDIYWGNDRVEEALLSEPYEGYHDE